MPINPTVKASFAEWRTVLTAARHYREYLAATTPGIEDGDQQLIAFDDIERLDPIIRGADYQMGEERISKLLLRLASLAASSTSLIYRQTAICLSEAFPSSGGECVKSADARDKS